jgi:hypothetical protein
MSKYPCEFCRGTGVISGEPIDFTNDWTADHRCSCTTILTEQEMGFLRLFLTVQENKVVLISEVLEHTTWLSQPVGMRDDLWEQFLNKLRTTK